MAARKKTPVSTRPSRKKAAAKKKAPGRPTKYSDTMPQALMDFYTEAALEARGVNVPVLKEIGVTLPTMTGFAMTVGVTQRTLYNWADAHPEFADAMKWAIDIQADMLQQMTLSNVWNPNMAMFSLKANHNWVDKVTVDTNAAINLYFDKTDEEA